MRLTTADGRRLKWLPVVDECTRESHAILVERSITGADGVGLLAHLCRVHGEPEFVRSDNGPEFIAEAVKTWLAQSGVRTLDIEPGSPWENASSESFNSRFRDELLDRELFTSVTEAKGLGRAVQARAPSRATAQLAGVPDAGRVRGAADRRRAAQRRLCA